jgi:hypothetical protein
VSKVWQAEVGERNPPFIVPTCCSGDMMRFAPATIAASQSPFLMAVTAWWRAYIVDEHAVSNVKL